MKTMPFVTKFEPQREAARSAMLQGLIPISEYIETKKRIDEEERLAIKQFLAEIDEQAGIAAQTIIDKANGEKAA